MADPLSMASELTCSVCLEIYTDPLMLSCMHSYCRKCLKDVHTKTVSENEDQLQGAVGGTKTLQCPNCRKPTVLGGDGVDGLPSNFTLASIADKLKISLNVDEKPVVLCSLCESDPKPAVKTCEDCSGTLYCRDCLQICHPMRGVFKKHTLTDIVMEKEISPTKDKEKTPMYCHTCEASFTSSPSIIPEKHGQHSVDTLDRAVENEKSYVDNVLKELKVLNEKQSQGSAKVQDEYHERKEQLRGVSQLLQNASRRVEDSMKDVETSYHDYQDSSRQFVTSTDELLQKASLMNTSGQREDKVSFLKFAKQMRSQVTKIRDCGSVKLFSLSNLDVFLRNLSGYVSQELGVYQSNPDQDTKEKSFVTEKAPTSVRITEIKNVPSCFDTASVRITWSPSTESVHYNMKCFLTKSSDGYRFREEFHVDIPPATNSLVLEGLRHKTLYTAQLIAKVGQQDAHFEQTFETAQKIECCWFWWNDDDCSPDMVYSRDNSVVTHKLHGKAMIKGRYRKSTGDWDLVNGTSSSIVFGVANRYWETLLAYKVLRQLSDGDIIVNIGICHDKEMDNFSPIYGDYFCLCLKLYKLSKQAKLGMKFWDGGKRSSERGSQTFDIEFKKEKQLRIGYFHNLETCTFKIVLIEKNVIIHTYSNIKNFRYAVICEILNEDKVQSAVELHTQQFTGLPTVLFD